MGGSATSLTRAAALPQAALLQSLSKSVLEDSSPAQLEQLQQFAEQHQDQEAGSLAYLALGYHFFQKKKIYRGSRSSEPSSDNPRSTE